MLNTREVENRAASNTYKKNSKEARELSLGRLAAFLGLCDGLVAPIGKGCEVASVNGTTTANSKQGSYSSWKGLHDNTDELDMFPGFRDIMSE